MLQSMGQGSGRRSTPSPAKCLRTGASWWLASPSPSVHDCTLADTIKSLFKQQDQPNKEPPRTLISCGIKPVVQSDSGGIQRVYQASSRIDRLRR